ncbi:MAG: hypothetical protein LBM97_01395, partial [Candidatus Nomurabacteria bacterium]|jgi:hypothetical protein|nr:hypothetical protein [Candidatus Nomurabacteria bacterium]
VARDEIEAHLVRQRSSAGVEISEDSFAKIIRDNYGLSLPEYKRIFVELPLLRSKLAAKVDVLANQNVAVALAAIREGKSFSEIAEASDGEIILETSGGEVSNMNLDGGRAERAFEMEVGQVSESFVSRSGDAFFIVKTIKKDEDKVEYESLRMPLTVLMNKFLQVKNEGQVREYIEL